MNPLLSLLIFTASPAFAIRAPSLDELASLSSNTAAAYADRRELLRIERRLRDLVGSHDTDWEDRLSVELARELSAARIRASASMSTLLEETLIAYELIPVKPSPVGGSGIPQYPAEVMQGGPHKGVRRPWSVIFAQPREGDVRTSDGTVLRGEAFKRFLAEHNGLSNPDGTTLVWGDSFLHNHRQLPITLSHELSHFKLFADPHWVNERTWTEREVEAHKRSRDAIPHMGFPKDVQETEIAREQYFVERYETQVSMEKGKHERRSLLERIADRLRALAGLRESDENPGYSQLHSFHIDPEALARIRGDSDRLKARADAQRQERAMDALAADFCADPKSASRPDLRARYAAVTGSRLERTLPAPDSCVELLTNVLWQFKTQGQDYDTRTIAMLAPSAPSRVLQSDTILESRLGRIAERVCRMPTDAWDPKIAEEFRAIPRIQNPAPPTLDRKTCKSRILNELWRWNRAGRTDFDPGRLSEITAEPTIIDAPAILPRPPQKAEPPADTPSPAPADPGPPPPAPRVLPDPGPPCLHDRCARKV